MYVRKSNMKAPALNLVTKIIRKCTSFWGWCAPERRGNRLCMKISTFVCGNVLSSQHLPSANITFQFIRCKCKPITITPICCHRHPSTVSRNRRQLVWTKVTWFGSVCFISNPRGACTLRGNSIAEETLTWKPCLQLWAPNYIQLVD